MDSIVESHDERVLERWEAQQAQWRAQAAALCAATGKQERDLTLSRGEEWRRKLELLARRSCKLSCRFQCPAGEEWRRKLELLAALEVAVPAAAAAAHKVNKAKIISEDGGCNSRRPNSDGGSGSKGSINDGDSAGTVAAASGQWMATLRNANERFVMALAPAAPDAEALVVTGSSLDCAGLAASLALQPVGLAAVEARMAVADPSLFKEYQQQGVILPGEQQRFRFSFKAEKPGIYHESWALVCLYCTAEHTHRRLTFSFKAQQPGIFHESWAMACHPPLLPDPEAPAGSEARRKGHCVRVHLKGTAVASGSAVPGEDRAWAAAAAAAAGAATGGEGAGGRAGLQQEQQQLEARLARQCRDAQQLDRMVSKLAGLYSQALLLLQSPAAPPEPKKAAGTATRAQERCVGMHQGSGFLRLCTQQTYRVVSKLAGLYGQALLLLQPPAPPPEPKKGV
ncbi:hypothetical protein OEZ86_007091 [Tetradesmus obliquus]|nr:hypothetical protein OEZ86_007091 [Tetradesmus obliquus]